MTKRLAMLTVLLVFGLMLTGVLFAQDQPTWDLSEVFTVPDLQLQFNYPKGWVNDTSQGIYLAETQADLDAQIDSDQKTVAKGLTISVSGVPVSALGLDENPSMDQVTEKIVELTGVKLDEQIDFPVLAHRAVIVSGSSPDGRHGAAVLWMQQGIVVIFSMGTPDSATTNRYSRAFGQLVGTVRPIDTLELSEPMDVSGFPDYTMRYPKDWFVQGGDSSSTFYELESDSTRSGTGDDRYEGVIMVWIHTDTSQNDVFGDNPTVEAVLKSALKRIGYEEPFAEQTEYILFGQPALGAKVSSAETYPARAVAGLVEKEAYILIVIAPDDEALDAFETTRVAILQSIQPVNTGS